jgi:transposase
LVSQTPTPNPNQPLNFLGFSGIDVAAKTFTLATLLSASTATPNAKPKVAPKPFEQSGTGFSEAKKWLAQAQCSPEQHLVVMEATGSYWIALACALHEAGFAVAVINPAQAHYFAKAQLKRAKSDSLDAQTLTQLAQALQAQLTLGTPPPPSTTSCANA